MHRYFPDFWVEKDDGTQMVIEVKPKQHLVPPPKPKRRTKRYIKEVAQFAVINVSLKLQKSFVTIKE